jgi:hypothetical protein
MENQEELNLSKEPTVYNSNTIKAEAYLNYALPTFKYSYDGKYVQWLDVDGKTQWPDKLLEYKNNCTLHGALCKSIIAQIQGAGFIYDTSTSKSRTTEEFLNVKNKNSDDFYKVFCKFVEDEYSFGLGSIIINYTSDKTSISNIEYVNMRQLRASPIPIDSSILDIPGWWWSWDWSGYQKQKLMVFLPSNNFKVLKDTATEYNDILKTIDTIKDVNSILENLQKIEQMTEGENSRVLVHQPTRDTLSFYYKSLPPYAAGINSIKADIAADRYNINNMEHGLNIDSIMQVPGITSNEAKLKFGNELYAQYRNPNRGKQTLLVFPIDDQHKITLDPLNTNSEATLYTRIIDQVAQKIIQAHRISSPLLVAQKTAGQLGGAKEMDTAEDIFYKNVVKAYQLKMIEPFNQIMEYNGLEKLSIDRLNKVDTQTTETLINQNNTK